jgi:hypothetical protein
VTLSVQGAVRRVWETTCPPDGTGSKTKRST